jgi:two-component system, cell cycle sensor histidine kinase and response regulator CckA
MTDRTFPERGPDRAAVRFQTRDYREHDLEEERFADETDPPGDFPEKPHPASQPDSCRDFMEQMPFGVLTVRPDFRVDYINGRFRDMFGYEIQQIPDIRSWFEKFMHKPVSNSVVEQIFNTWALKASTAAGMHWESMIAVQTKRGGTRLCLVHFVALADGRLLTTYENAAERSRIESEMQYTKVDSVSILTSGLDLIMDGIVEGLQGLLETLQGQESPAVRQIQCIEREARSGSNLLLKIRSFAGGRSKEARPVDLNEILRKTSTIFANTKGGITVRRELKEDLWPLEIDRLQLEKMLIHLYIHLQQMSPKSGEFHIEADNACLSTPEATLYRLKPGRYIKVTLAAGAAEHGQAGRPKALRLSSLMNDSGLRDNLSIIYAQCIVQSHGGVMSLSDDEEFPPVIQILLPASESRSVSAPARRDIAPSGRTILLVDDDEILIEVIREILETAGYRVITAANGHEALEIHEAWGDNIDLVMLDMIMPGMGGAETFTELKKIDPDVPVIIISGYSLPDEVGELLSQGCEGFLQKPFLIPDLLQKIRQVSRRDEGKRLGK